MNSMKTQKGMTVKDELPRSVGAQYATGDQWRKNSRKNEEIEPKLNLHPGVDVMGDVRVLTKRGLLETEMANHCSILALRTP